MIHKVIEFSIQNRALVVISFCAIACLALFSFKTSRIDALPDIGENQQIVFTPWPGHSPKDVEEQITYPLSLILQGIPGVKTVRGTSAFGFSTISLIFKEEIDFYWSRSRILEKISTIQNNLPAQVVPQMGPDATGLGQVFWYTLENTKTNPAPQSLAELRSLQDFYVRYLLQGVEGVSEVSSVGGFVKEYQIDVDPKKLFAYNIHFSELIKAIKNSNLDVGAEVIEDGEQEFIVRGKGFFKSLEDIENVVLSVKNKTPIRVQDVASVGYGPAFRRGTLDKNGKEAVGGVVTMRFGENPKQVIDRIKQKLKSVQKGLPPGVQIVPFMTAPNSLKNTIGTVYSALIQEIIITIMIIFLFLLHFRSSFLVSLTLPLGVGISFILMKYFNIDSNVMSLSGLVIAIGSMVDMSIIMVESIYSHLSEKNNVHFKQKVKEITQAACAVAPSILTAVTTTLITFLPVFALEGSSEKLFTPLAWAKTLALFGSLTVALILLPAFCVYFLKGKLKPLKKNKLSLTLVQNYSYVLNWILENRKKFLIAPLTLITLGVLAFSQLGKEFMPSLNEGDILYMPTTTPNISLTKARELLAYTDRVLNEHPLVEYAVGKLGRVDSALDPAPISMFETTIKLIPQNQWPRGKTIYEIMEDLDQSLQIPGLVNSWDFPIQTRIGMISTGIKTQIGIKLFGDDLATLEKLAYRTGEEIKKIKGAYGVYTEQIVNKPYIEFDVDRVAASRYGINTGTVNEILQTAVGGMPIGQFYDGRRRYPIRVRYKKELRDRVDELKQVLVPSPLGQHIPLEQLAHIKVVTGPAVIPSENGLLRALVLFNVRGRDLMGFVKEAQKHIEKNVKIPTGYSLVWSGQYENQVKASKRLKILIPLSLLINFIIIS